VFTFFFETHQVWEMSVLTIALGFIAGIVQVSLVFALKRLNIPALTISFNIVLMMILLSVNGNIMVATPRRAPRTNGTERIDGTPTFLLVLEGTTKGVGQFIFADTIAGGVLIYVAVFMCKRVDSFGALAGSFVATVTAAYIHRVAPDIMPAVRDGLWSYNGMGCGAAFASGLFTERTVYNFIFGLTGSAVSVLAMGAIASVVDPLPVLTFPFVLTTIIMLMARHHGELARQSASSESSDTEASLCRDGPIQLAEHEHAVDQTPLTRLSSLKDLHYAESGSEESDSSPESALPKRHGSERIAAYGSGHYGSGIARIKNSWLQRQNSLSTTLPPVEVAAVVSASEE
jgi:hypothetical protein